MLKIGIMETIDRLKNVAEKSKNVDLLEEIAKLRVNALELQNENFRLKEEIYKLKQDAIQDVELIYDNPVYYKKDDLEKNDAYCTGCWDMRRKLIRVHRQRDKSWKCPICHGKHTPY